MEELVVVDKNDNVLGLENKEKCHKGKGILHRGFSVYILNKKGELLIQRRSKYKKTWPLFWSNTVCSHPRKDENYKRAAERRLKEELGFSCKLKYLYKFMYRARFKDMSENEMCAVLIGLSEKKPKPNPKEIAEWKYVKINDLKKQMRKTPRKFTPWFRMELKKLLRDYKNEMITKNH